MKLTDARVRNLNYDPEGSKIQRRWDEQIPGLGLEVFPQRKSWVYRYRIAGKQRIITVGHLADMDLDAARDRVLELRGLLREGIDPKGAVRRVHEAQTVAQLFERYTGGRYFASRSPDFRTNFQSALRRYLLPVIGDHAVEAVKRWQIRQAVDDLIEQNKEGAARGLLTHTRVLFNYAVEHELIEASPADHIRPRYATSGRRVAWLDTPDKLRAAWYFKGAIQVRGMLRWLVLAGCRRDEARLLEREHIVGGVWTCPTTKTGGKPIPRGSWHYQLRTHADFHADQLRHTAESMMADLGVWSRSAATWC